jgi:hypothetical protein
MTQAYSPKFPQTVVGSLYPTNYVVGVIDDLEDAQQASQAFADTGYAINEIRLMVSQEALDKVQELENRKNRFQRFFSSFQSATDETGADVYHFEAKLGHHILYVRAFSQSEIEKICELMERFHAHTMKFFGMWSVADIAPRKMEQH